MRTETGLQQPQPGVNFDYAFICEASLLTWVMLMCNIFLKRLHRVLNTSQFVKVIYST